ncbi:uncharacterized protein LOC117343489 isoform X2 [Pecten maximus]|uniref:uncharacterized protein LOC117343489 isoform X2 n=1 Tax=Pecten maximus TaxID=6579 RepID=UPI00145882BD|nr:uncharacterized protein LOC117343489 isoform X2 [Pecten maximus]
MKICYRLLLVLFLGYVPGYEEATGPVPCFPKCPLSEEGRRLCESLLLLEPCVELTKRPLDDATDTCSCEWSDVLSHPGYSSVPDNSKCLLYSLETCDAKIRHSRDTTGRGYSINNFVREIQNENSRIEKITDESEKREAKVRMLSAVRDIINLIRKLEGTQTGKPGGSASKDTRTTGATHTGQNQDPQFTGKNRGSIFKDTRTTGATPTGNDPDPQFMGVWNTPAATTKKPPVKMSPMKNDHRFEIAMFASVIFLLLVILALCLLAKLKTDRAGVNLDIVGDLDLEKRRYHRLPWREKATENARRGQFSRGLLSHNKIGKPPMAVPSKSSLGRKNSNTSVKDNVDKKTDSCTLISGLTHGNTTGSDVELDNEFGMFKTNFQEDFKSLLNANQDK